MAVLLHEKRDNTTLGLWEISEQIPELLEYARLAPEENLSYSKINAEHRKKEWLATRALLNALIGKHCPIGYYADGRPFIEGQNQNISISHSAGYVAIFLHEQHHPGIDIELNSRVVGKVGNRFLSIQEMERCNQTPESSNYLMLLHWCAKEAIFKMIPRKEIIFSSDIQVQKINLSDRSGTIEGSFIGESVHIPILLNFRLFNQLIIIYGDIDKTIFDSFG